MLHLMILVKEKIKTLPNFTVLRFYSMIYLQNCDFHNINDLLSLYKLHNNYE